MITQAYKKQKHYKSNSVWQYQIWVSENLEVLNQLKKKLRIVYIITEGNARIYKHYNYIIRKLLLLTISIT